MYAELIDHLQGRDVPLRVPRRGPFTWDDEVVHTRAYAADPAGYALLALLPGVRRAQRARVLLRLLDSSWAAYDGELRATLTRVVRLLQDALAGEEVAAVLLALRHRRANHRHVTRAVRDLLTVHRQADALVRTHRAVLVDVLEHGLGKATARGLARRVDPDDAAPLARRLRQLYAGAERPDVGPVPPSDLDGARERPATVTVTNRGDVAATLVHALRGGTGLELQEALDRYVAAAAAPLPDYPGTVALVLDRSESMHGYGDREWATFSQAEAFRLVLERRCERLVVVPVGGSGAPGEAGGGRAGHPVGGSTDLATGLLDALSAEPDVVAVVSDGYENVYPGDLARVVATLPQAGVRVPVVFWHATFGHSDDLALRRPAPDLPQRAFWHEADLVPLLVWTVARVASGHPDDAATVAATRWLHEALHRRLDLLERAVRPEHPPLQEVIW